LNTPLEDGQKRPKYVGGLSHVCILLYLTIPEKKWEYNDVVHQLFRDLQKDYDSVTGRSCTIFSMGLVSP
jgi:hypothetical protein